MGQNTYKMVDDNEKKYLSFSSDLFITYSSDGSIIDAQSGTHFNPLVPVHSIIGKTVDEIMPPHLSLLITSSIQTCLLSNKELEIQFEVQKDKESIFYREWFFPQGNGTVIGVVREITNEKKYEQELKQIAYQLEVANENLKKVARTTYHELREPIRSIVGLTQIIHKKYQNETGDDLKDYCSLIIENAKRLEYLTSHLADFTSLRKEESSKASLVSPRIVVENVCKELELEIKRNDAQITIGKLPPSDIPSGTLSRIFTHLISNALLHSGKTEHLNIIISSKEEPSHIHYSVSDDGEGIPEEYRESIFDIFVQLNAQTRMKGAGLGLPIVKKLLSFYDGEIRVLASPEGGATFTFSVPKG